MKRNGILINIECVFPKVAIKMAEALTNFFVASKQSAVCCILPESSFDEVSKSPIKNCLNFAAELSEIIRDKVNPGLDEDKIAVSANLINYLNARFTFGEGLEPKKVKAIENIVVNKLKADFTVFLEISPDNSGINAKTKEEKQAQEMVSYGYNRIFLNKKDVIKIMAEKQEKDILNEIVSTLIARGVVAL